ncbi:mechanosensitive ion channel [bacterium]|nr:mechanosensitive ion channel [bacterium]MBU1982912.1 mechanosensitive ion channel [bacterium]
MFEVFTEKMAEMAGGYWPRLLAAIAVLVIGWLAALGVAGLVRSGLHRLKLDERMGKWLSGDGQPKPVRAERMVGRIVYYLLILLVFVAFFQTLSLTMAVVPINAMLAEVTAYLPNLIGAALLLILAWIMATILRAIVYKALTAAKIDERVTGAIDRDSGEPVALARPLSAAVYWVIFLLFLPAILGALALDGLLGPVQSMLTPALEFLPNLVSAALILLIGLFVAHLLRGIVTNVLAAAGVDKFSEKMGLSAAAGTRKLSGVIGLIVYILVLIPVLVGTLDALQLEALTRPASNMLDAILLALPNIFGAALLLVLAYIIGRVVAKLASELLTSIGFNSLLVKLGIGREPKAGERTLSEIAGTVILVAIMLFASLEALNLLYFNLAAGLLQQFLVFIGNVLLGVLIFTVGLYLANLAANALRSKETKYPALLPMVARLAILVMAGAMALRQAGLAAEIVVIAFGILVGAVAVAFAIAFGVGGVKFASQKIEEWLQSQQSGQPRT